MDSEKTMSDDLISRQTAIETIKQVTIHSEDESLAVEALGELPSTQINPIQIAVNLAEYTNEEIERLKRISDNTPIILLPSDECTKTEIKYIPDNGWIPVSERLPEEDKDVLVTVYFKGLVQKHKTGWNDHVKPKSYVEVASQIDGEWHSYSDEYKVARDRHVVTAWKPLPEPYKGEAK